MEAKGPAIPSWETVVGTLMKGTCCRAELSLAASIFVPPPTAKIIRGFQVLIRSSTAEMSFMVTVSTRIVSTFMPVCWSWLRTFCPAISQLFCPAMMRAEPVKPSLCVTSATRFRVPFPTMTSRGSCM